MNLGQALIAVCATGYITWVLVYSKVFLCGRDCILRHYTKHHRMYVRHGLVKHRIGRSVFSKVNQLLVCPFCSGFWVWMAFQSIFRWNLLDKGILGVVLTGTGFALGAAVIAYFLGVMTVSIVERQNEME